MRVSKYHTYVGPHTNLEKQDRFDICNLNTEQVSVVVNALENYAMAEPEGGSTQLIADDLVMQITRVTGY